MSDNLPLDGVKQTATGKGFLDAHGIVRFECDHGVIIDEAAAITNTEAIIAAADGGR